MRLVELDVLRLPGIPEGFRLKAGGGVTIVTGPNGSGKSSLTRALRSLFWESVETGAPFAVEADFETDEHTWKAAREDGRPVRWWRDGAEHPAPETPGSFLQRCYEMGVLDLVLPPGGEVETELAAIINREMSGGVDLVAIAGEHFKDRSRQATILRRQWQEAHRTWQELLAEQHGLAEEENGLGELRRQYAAGQRAAAHLPWWQDWRKRRQIQASLAGLEARLQTFPAGQDRVRADDAALLDRLLTGQDDARRQIQEKDARLAGQRRTLQEMAWPDTDPELLDQRIEALATLEKERHQAAEALARAEARRRQAQQDLLPHAGDLEGIPTPSAQAHDKLARAYARLAARRGLKEGLDTLLHLPEWQDQDSAATRDQRLDLLRTLLVAPEPAPGPAVWAAWLSVAGILAAGIGWTVQGPETGGMFLTGAGLLSGGLLGWQYRRRRQAVRAAGRHRVATLAALRETGLDIPELLSPHELVRLHGELSADRGTASARRQWWAQLQGRRQALDEEASREQAELEKLERQEGLGLDLDMPELLNLLQALPRLRAARDDEAAQKAARDRLDRERTQLLDLLARDLAAFGEEAPPDLEAGRAALQRIRRLENRRRDARQEIRDLEREMGTLRRDRDRMETEIQTFWDRLGLPGETDRQVVSDLVAGRESWQALRDEAAGQRGVLAELDQHLETPPDGLDTGAAAELDPEEVASRIADLQRQADEAADLKTHIALVEQRIQSARHDHRVARAAAAEEAAREALESLRDSMRAAALGRYLLEDVENSHQRATRPRVLEQAGRLFREFTADLYELRVVPGPTRQGRFVAHDLQRGIDLGLAEISDGTRAQLLLAVRLAFITENEDGVQPPLFLDESLTSTDPGRFAAIARNLSRWAGKGGRQVFYLTSNPADAAAWRAAQQDADLPTAPVVDLAEQRGLSAAAPLPPHTTAPPELPAPGRHGAEDYARRLGVPRLDPWQPAATAHLWYLLFDDLDLLYRLLQAAAPTLGLFRARQDRLPVLARLQPADGTHLQARGAALEAFLSLWRIGRGRPLIGHDLVRSGQVSERFLPECLDLLNARQGDAALFVQDLRDRRVKGFRKNNLAALEEFLDAEGFLDSRTPLDAEALLGRVQTLVMEEIRPGHLGTKETRHLVDTWRRVLNPVGQAGEATDRSS